MTKKGLDSFERFKVQAETRRKRLRNNNGDPKSGFSQLKDPLRLGHPRHPLSDRTNITNKPPQPKPVKISNIRSALVSLHKDIGAQSDPTRSNQHNNTNDSNLINILQLSQTMKMNSKKVYKSYNVLYDYLVSELGKFPKPCLNDLDELICLQTFKSFITFATWFKHNKFEYVLVDKDSSMKNSFMSKISNLLESSCEFKPDTIDGSPILDKESINQKLIRCNYIRPQFRKNNWPPPPTHLITSWHKIGIFLISANVKDLETNDSSQVLLTLTDMKIPIEKDCLVVLNDEVRYDHMINDKVLPMYLNWHVYKEGPSNSDFF